ncbi:hypothetical protein KY366_03405 [Candidatus Woesearchaeota archaeon]|nr:hypothetical protein [Candidatus Woesearchaeota archaeon]
MRYTKACSVPEEKLATIVSDLIKNINHTIGNDGMPGASDDIQAKIQDSFNRYPEMKVRGSRIIEAGGTNGEATKCLLGWKREDYDDDTSYYIFHLSGWLNCKDAEVKKGYDSICAYLAGKGLYKA